MPKIAAELTDLQVRRLDRPGWHAVGGVPGLLLQVRKPTGASTKLSRSWVLRIKNGSKRVPLGLGSYPQLTLKEAREKARRLVLEARDGVDLLESKRHGDRRYLMHRQSPRPLRRWLPSISRLTVPTTPMRSIANSGPQPWSPMPTR
jgi:hypothetical protein